MVHLAPAPDVQRPFPLPAPAASLQVPAAARYPYLLVPDALILAFAHDPLAVGVYVAIARLTLAARGAVPVAARDLSAWMGSERDADRAAIMRRIVRLVDSGWLSLERNLAAKHHLLPTWGSDSSGKLRPWRFDQEFYGKPEHVRGRRIPFTLLDTYIGRLETRSGQLRGLISRYFSRPLLDFTDVGVFTISLRCEIELTKRLTHLGLVHKQGLLVLPDWSTLLIKAEQGALTTIDEEQPVQIQLSMHGRAKLTTLPPLPSFTDESLSNSEGGSVAGSTTGSPDGSLDGSAEDTLIQSTISQHNAENIVPDKREALIAWEDGSFHKPINQESPHEMMLGGGLLHQQGSAIDEIDVDGGLDDVYASAKSQVSPAVVLGHESLNLDRNILSGEWYELYSLQQEHGAEQLLIWQARASRVSQSRSYGITPGYYRTCATRQAAEKQESRAQATAPRKITSSGNNPATLDPACDAVLRHLGVRARQQLVDVPLQLIMEWQAALAHPGLTARVTSPLGFAVNQMKCGNAPPTTEELDHWAEQTERNSNHYQSWRFFQQEAPIAAERDTEQDLEQRVRAIAPADATIAELCIVAELIEAGRTDADAQQAIRVMRSGATP